MSFEPPSDYGIEPGLYRRARALLDVLYGLRSRLIDAGRAPETARLLRHAVVKLQESGYEREEVAAAYAIRYAGHWPDGRASISAVADALIHDMTVGDDQLLCYAPGSRKGPRP